MNRHHQQKLSLLLAWPYPSSSLVFSVLVASPECSMGYIARLHTIFNKGNAVQIPSCTGCPANIQATFVEIFSGDEAWSNGMRLLGYHGHSIDARKSKVLDFLTPNGFHIGQRVFKIRGASICICHGHPRRLPRVCVGGVCQVQMYFIPAPLDSTCSGPRVPQGFSAAPQGPSTPKGTPTAHTDPPKVCANSL